MNWEETVLSLDELLQIDVDYPDRPLTNDIAIIDEWIQLILRMALEAGVKAQAQKTWDKAFEAGEIEGMRKVIKKADITCRRIIPQSRADYPEGSRQEATGKPQEVPVPRW